MATESTLAQLLKDWSVKARGDNYDYEGVVTEAIFRLNNELYLECVGTEERSRVIRRAFEMGEPHQ